MLFLVRFEDIYGTHPERLPERQEHLQAHLDFLGRHPDTVVASGHYGPHRTVRP